MAEIYVNYSPISTSGNLVYHKYITYHRDNGDVFLADAGGSITPNYGLMSGIFANIINDLLSGWPGFGLRVAKANQLSADQINYGKTANNPKELIISGPDAELDKAWNSIVGTVAEVNARKEAYDMLDNNSNGFVDEALEEAGLPEPVKDDEYLSPGSLCFGAGTLISMADGTQKPIERIEPGDMVLSFDAKAENGRGGLMPGKVVRLFRNHSPHMLDFHGTRVTPGHAYLCGDGPHEGRFRPLIDIIRDDGAVVLADGARMRAATGCALGSRGDAVVELQLAHYATDKSSGKEVLLLKDRACVRAGTRVQRPDGTSFSFLELIETNGWTLHANGWIGQGAGHEAEPLMWSGRALPKPEDFILSRSGVTLADLYDDPRQDERPASPSSWPMRGQTHAASAGAGVLHAAGPRTQAAQTASNASAGPGPSRKVRRKLEADRRKQGRVRKHAGMTVH